MAISSGETISMRAVFTKDGSAVDPSQPVNFYVKKRVRGSTKQGPYLGTRETEGNFTATFTPASAGRYDFSVESADGVIEEGEFYVRKKRV